MQENQSPTAETSPTIQTSVTLPTIDALLDSLMSAADVADSCEDIYSIVTQALTKHGQDAAFALYDFFEALQNQLVQWEPA